MKAFESLINTADPRVVGRCKHKLSDILIIALATYLCGGDDYVSMYELCKDRGAALYPLVELPNGCPSVDTFERVLQHINPDSLRACLEVYGKDLIGELQGKLVSIDGKRVRGASTKNGTIHILSAWVDEHSLSLAQTTVEEKANEIVAIPEVLDSLDLTGAVVSLDAMGTQTSIAEHIIKAGANYVLCLKANHKHLLEDVQDGFTGQAMRFTYSTLDKGHGRIEERLYTAISAKEIIESSEISAWQHLQSVVRVERKVTLSDGQNRHDVQYYLSSLDASLVSDIGTYIRGHWGIENRLHWQLDVTFGEDSCQASKGFAPINLNIIRKFAIAIVTQKKDKSSVQKRLFRAALNVEYLKELLKI